MSVAGHDVVLQKVEPEQGFAVSSSKPGPDFSIIIPCANERDNIAPMIVALYRVMEGKNWEAIFVDDNSPDGTSWEIERFARADRRVRGIRRVGRKGLSSAVIEGIMASSAPVFAVMDGDLQHDENQLVVLLTAISQRECDIAVASRHVEGGDNAGLATAWRRILSAGGTFFSRKILRLKLTDPMSGFFAARRECFVKVMPRLSGIGFKILLDFILAAPGLQTKEYPAQFRPRIAGESKLGLGVMIAFNHMVFEKITGGCVSFSFSGFVFVGVLIGLVTYGLSTAHLINISLGPGLIAVLVVLLSVAYFFNNLVSFYDRKRKGFRLLTGWLSFVLLEGVNFFVSTLGGDFLLAIGNLSNQVICLAIIALWGLGVGYALATSYIWRR